MSVYIDNPPAFPVPEIIDTTGDYGQLRRADYQGMTLRDYYAGQVAIGIVANLTGPTKVEEVAATCFELADAMLAERANPVAPADRPAPVTVPPTWKFAHDKNGSTIVCIGDTFEDARAELGRVVADISDWRGVPQ